VKFSIKKKKKKLELISRVQQANYSLEINFSPPPLLPGVKTQRQKHAAKGDKFTHYWKVTAFQRGGEK
jgi:hypothetical protein